jgi:hypothetical protein
MSMIVHHFSLVLEKVALANPPTQVIDKPSGRKGTKFLNINRTGTKSTTPGTTLLGKQVSGSGGGSAAASGKTRNVRNVMSGLLEKKPALRTDGKDAVTGGFLTEAGNAEVPGAFNTNRGLKPTDPKYDMFAGSPGFTQTQLPGGGTRSSNRSVQVTTQPAGWKPKIDTTGTLMQANTMVSGTGSGAQIGVPSGQGSAPSNRGVLASSVNPTVSRMGVGSTAANTYDPLKGKRTYHGGGHKPMYP